jgi:hypothetical protein
VTGSNQSAPATPPPPPAAQDKTRDFLNEIRQGVQLKKVDTHAQNASSDKSQPGAPAKTGGQRQQVNGDLLKEIQNRDKLKKVPEEEKNVYSKSAKDNSLGMGSALEKRRKDLGYDDSESESESESESDDDPDKWK